MFNIPIQIPSLHEEDLEAVTKILKSNQLVQGEKCLEFEKIFCEYTGAKYAILVSSGTASLHLSLLALGIRKGDEVIIPALSFVATANVIELIGATPVFVDTETDTFNIDTDRITSFITDKTKAIMPVHEFGLACDISEISRICKKHNLRLIEDAACALGAVVRKKHVGTYGDFGAFSFHPRKAITSGEGGIITTNNKELADKVRAMRNHGISYNECGVDFVTAGLNYRLTDFQANMLISQMKRFDNQLERKNIIAKYYLKNINNPLLHLPTIKSNSKHTWQTFHILLNKKVDREKVIEFLKRQGIFTNYGAQCIPALTYYKKKYNFNCEDDFPNSYNAYLNGLVIPLYEKLAENEIKHIVEVFNQIV